MYCTVDMNYICIATMVTLRLSHCQLYEMKERQSLPLCVIALLPTAGTNYITTMVTSRLSLCQKVYKRRRDKREPEPTTLMYCTVDITTAGTN